MIMRPGIRFKMACALAITPLSAAAAAKQNPHSDIVVYDIRRGDTLSRLATTAFDGPRGLAIVERLNRIINPDRIVSGQRLRIPRGALRDERTVARIEATSGAVAVRGGGALAAQVGAAIGEGGSIDTGRHAFVTLRLSDASTVAIPSETKVRILRLRRVILTGAVEREFRVEAGHIRAKVTPMRDPGSSFRVVTPITVSAVRGTEFRVDFDAEAGRATTEVEVGKVATSLLGRKVELVVAPGFGAAATKSTSTGLLPLIAAPDVLDRDYVQTGPELLFGIKKVPSAAGYRIQIARDAGILDTLQEERSSLPEFKLPSVAAGTYFARVSAIDGSGIEGLPRIFAFDRFRNSVSGTMTASGAGKERRYLFKWGSDADGAPRFRFQLNRTTGGAVPVVDEVALADGGVTVSNLPAGEYSWRVLSILSVRGRLQESWSPEQSFTVSIKK